MPDPSCAECIELAPELSLNVLTGRERARVLAHLEGCPRCREMIGALSATADELLSLIPEAEPPPGFVQRVISAVTPDETATHPSRWPMATAATLLSLTLIGAGWLAGTVLPSSDRAVPGSEPGTRNVLYAPLTNHSQEVGQAYLEPDQPSWVYLSLSANVRADTKLRCTLTDPDGASASLGTFALDHGQGGWTLPVPLHPDRKIVATITDDSGRVIGSARFTSDSPGSKTQDVAKSSAGDSSQSAHDHKDKKSDKDKHSKDKHKHKHKDKDKKHHGHHHDN
jgi:putative zinc finger protein